MQDVSTPNPCIVQGSSLCTCLIIWMFSQLRHRSFVWFLTWNVVISIEFLIKDYRNVLRLSIHIFTLSFRKVEPVIILTSTVWNHPCSFIFSLYEITNNRMGSKVTLFKFQLHNLIVMWLWVCGSLSNYKMVYQ